MAFDLTLKPGVLETETKSDAPLTTWESIFAALCGALFGLIGLIVVYFRASRFKADGYVLKARKSWRLFWLGFGARFAVVVILLIIAVAGSR